MQLRKVYNAYLNMSVASPQVFIPYDKLCDILKIDYPIVRIPKLMLFNYYYFTKYMDII